MRQRSSYPKSFKAQIVYECLQPDATISGVAVSHGINANVIRNWMPLYRDQPPAMLPAFIPVKSMPKRPIETSAVIDLPFGNQSITVKWPTSDPEGCSRFVRGFTQ
ncbi:IS66-like element accessory protein TnpA [Pseudomonas fluorescens]|uniref:IS66-like element accessory protein TnpA n=1 Tax=Pseudomonas fluorescens TaxID=294 RepID=UPI003F9E6214